MDNKKALKLFQDIKVAFQDQIDRENVSIYGLCTLGIMFYNSENMALFKYYLEKSFKYKKVFYDVDQDDFISKTEEKLWYWNPLNHKVRMNWIDKQIKELKDE